MTLFNKMLEKLDFAGNNY